MTNLTHPGPLVVKCPRCGAPHGQSCRRLWLWVRDRPHGARIAYWLQSRD